MTAIAAKPLFRDPIFDGAADPILIWNRQRQTWWMFYTNRRANVPELPGVSWVHGTALGIAESTDGGANWRYLSTAEIAYGDDEFSYWAPDIVFHQSLYHMYLTFVPGMHTDWSGTRSILHLTSTDLLHWNYQSTLELSSDHVIDASVCRLADGTWRLWYNDEPDHKSIYFADSPDLYHWTDGGKVLGDQPGEEPKVFIWQDWYWMIVDIWDGLLVYRSDDAVSWTRQAQSLLAVPGHGLDDEVKGGHADVVVSGDRAFLFYFTHPGRVGDAASLDGYEQRRTSIQVTELHYHQGTLTCDRDTPTAIALLPDDRL